MSRKKLTNNESFIFDESDVVNPIRSRALSDRSSVQRRLFPKSENLEGPRNPPLAPHNNPPVAPRNNLLQSSHSSNSQALSHDKLGRAGPAGDHNATKNTATKDPSLEAGLNVAKNTATTDPSLELGLNGTTTDPSLEAIMSKLASLDTGSLQAASTATDAAQSKSTSMVSKPKPATSKRVLLQVVPKSVSQEVLHPFKPDFQKINVSNNNSSLNNGNMENGLNKSKATFNNNETGAMAKNPEISSKRGTYLAGPDRGTYLAGPERDTLLAGPAAADETFQKRDLNENEQDQPETCICLRPLKLILCPVCGYTTTGRLRKPCQVHPKDVYLLDVDACPRCKETNKSVFVEYELPEGFKQAVNKTIN